MSEQLTPAQTNFVWDQFRAGGHNGLSDAQVEALFDTIDRLRAERRVTKGLHTKIDQQAATIQQVREVSDYIRNRTEWPPPRWLILEKLAEALDGGTK